MTVGGIEGKKRDRREKRGKDGAEGERKLMGTDRSVVIAGGKERVVRI